MSMLGIDLGNWSCCFVCEGGRPPFIDFPPYHVNTYISQIKCLLGRKFSDPELQMELDFVPFRVIEGPDGCPLVHGRCKGEDRAFTPVEILAMLISTPKFLARDYFRSPPRRCIGIPIDFTDQQKMDVLHAAEIVGLREDLSLLDETTAMIMAHESMCLTPKGIVAFVDIGHASMQVCFAEFKQNYSNTSLFPRETSVNILYKGYSKSLGGREFDKVLFKHFASKIQKEYNIDVSENSSDCVRLSEACERLKINLSHNCEASFCIKKFSGSTDVKGSITRKYFEILSISILKKIEVALKNALSESGLNVQKVDSLEAVGNGCSIPAIIDILTKIFGKKERQASYSYRHERQTSYSYEHVADGCHMHGIQLNITGMNKMIHNLTRALETSELVSSELNSEEENAKDSENFLWRRAMEEEGHLLTYLNDFLEKNMHRIERLEKTQDESYWLSKSHYFTDENYLALQDATNNFHDSFKLGEGATSIVYKGILHNTKTVAIKILKEGISLGAKEFNQEVKILSKVWHPNLVNLVGACVEARAFIYEYLPNGSLEDHLQCKDNTSPLSWQARVRIAFEICSALSFLHSRKPHVIVHGDLKPDNILLDSNNTSKICDSGLYRELNFTASTSIPYHAYMDPEYLPTGKTTPQYDVYSFGIILLRLVTCKDPQGLRNLVEEAQKKGTLKAFIDALAGPWPFREAKKMISLGLRCSDLIRKNRPDLSTEVSKELKSMLEVANYCGEYSYSELQNATNNFDESFKLGEGGFGIVYKGNLNNTPCAIKMLKEGSHHGTEDFNQEIEILSKVQHPNLVKLIGARAETRALIYEYLPNGSLEDRLRCKNNTLPLSWQARVRIAFEICSALSFLHCSEPHGIVHGDLKPDNILLDENDTSKICDFGLCRELNFTASASIPYHAYMDPEYLPTGKTTPQYDVYSFGIILLRLVTCKDPQGLRNLVEEAQKKGTLKAFIDALAGPWPFREAKKMISLGLRCSDLIRKNRPDLSTEVSKELKSMLEVANYCGEYSYSELQNATNNFDESFKLGEGGFGIVYKGNLNNTPCAIKMLKEGSHHGTEDFNQEIEILSKVQHPNLVKLIGACAETRALIYEYLPNGSLEDRLRCKNNTLPLSWQARVRIAFEICSALSFLHSSEPHGIVHGDLKPDNILLDENDTSKICDFGLCRELDFTASASIPYHWTDCPRGTLAYMDLEYISMGKITPQYDAYSFGILLLRLVTCQNPQGLRPLVEEARKKGTLKTLIDASAGPWPFKEAKKMISLGLRCSDPIRKNRPDLSTKVLKEIKSMLEVASAPASSWTASLFPRYFVTNS